MNLFLPCNDSHWFRIFWAFPSILGHFTQVTDELAGGKVVKKYSSFPSFSVPVKFSQLRQVSLRRAQWPGQLPQGNYSLLYLLLPFAPFMCLIVLRHIQGKGKVELGQVRLVLGTSSWKTRPSLKTPVRRKSLFIFSWVYMNERMNA